jgi:hypothetical protein
VRLELATATLAALLLVSTGCVEDQLRPSHVAGLRVLGLAADPADAIAGEPLSLELLWADPAPPCGEEAACPAGRACVEGLCEREAPTQIAWLLLPLAAFEAAEDLEIPGSGTGGEGCIIDRCPPPTPCEADEECPGEAGRCREGHCAPCFAFGPATFCCGEDVDRVETVVPEADAEPRDCADPTAIDLARVLQVQAQVCAGGEIDLCPEPGSLSFGCVGQGADSVVAQSRLFIMEETEWPNARPVVAGLELDGSGWGEETREVRGCREEDCLDRACDGPDGCGAGQDCASGLCREVVELTLGEGALERYLEPCDSPASCEADSDCEAGWGCGEDGRCLAGPRPLLRGGRRLQLRPVRPVAGALHGRGRLLGGRPGRSRWAVLGGADDPRRAVGARRSRAPIASRTARGTRSSGAAPRRGGPWAAGRRCGDGSSRASGRSPSR